jgi:hypothetical protein
LNEKVIFYLSFLLVTLPFVEVRNVDQTSIVNKKVERLCGSFDFSEREVLTV